MVHQPFSSPHLVHLSFNIIFLVLPAAAATLSPPTDERYINCRRQFECGNKHNITYPFWGDPQPYYCGLPEFKLDCHGGFTVIQITSQKYRVLKIDHENHILRLARLDLYNSTCPSVFTNTSLTYIFSYTPNFGNVTLFYNCSSVSPALAPSKFTCRRNNNASIENGYFTVGSIPTDGDLGGNCQVSVTVPVIQSAVPALRENSTFLNQALNDGFEVHWIIDYTPCSECIASGGRCGYNTSFFQPICFCPDRSYLLRCPDANNQGSSKSDLGNQLLRAAFTFGVCTLLAAAVLFGCLRGKSAFKAIALWKKGKNNVKNLEAFLEKCGSLAPKQYSYPEIKKMTDSFKDKLGQGGYGSVYKGKLSDGSLVAVKVLGESKGNGEEFVNEVSSISKTSHINIVTLVGFCFDGSKRALIYEFMPNGSLDKYIYDENQVRGLNHPLGLERIYNIAIGIAHGLEYLHRGCSTRILHLDIKPQNILLDKDFIPKISDFGLAKLFPKKETKISMLGARGTVGYIAPEVFSRNFGVVSHKSDVYSYGMMILEMVGGRRNADTGFERGSETYFPHWIHKHLEQEEELRLQWSMNEKEEEVARKMILVGLWCIQTDPTNRPSMDGVVDMLQGNCEAIQLPPKPFPSSPIRPPARTSNAGSHDALSDKEVINLCHHSQLSKC